MIPIYRDHPERSERSEGVEGSRNCARPLGKVLPRCIGADDCAIVRLWNGKRLNKVVKRLNGDRLKN